MTLSSGQQRQIGIALVLLFVLALLLPFIQLRILNGDSQFMGWQVWLISFYALASEEVARHILLPILSAASLISLLLSIGLMRPAWRWIEHPCWRWFTLPMLCGYLIAPWVLHDLAQYLIGYYLGMLFHLGLALVLWLGIAPQANINNC